MYLKYIKFDDLCKSYLQISDFINVYRVSHKKWHLVLEGCSIPKFWARNKSRGCFGILRFSTFQNLNSSSRKKYYLQLHHLKRCHGLLYPRHQHGLLHPWHWHGHHYPWHRHALHHLQHCIVMVTTNITEQGRQRCCSCSHTCDTNQDHDSDWH